MDKLKGRVHWLGMSVILQRSPNCNARRHGGPPDMVVLHYTAMQTAEAALARLCDPVHEVSAHYLIGACGTCWQMVDEESRAWHAGRGAWHGIDDVNSHAIGIELANSGDQPFPEAQMSRLEILLAQILGRWEIPACNVIAHSDMAPTRKTDPGPHFDWRRLALSGLSIWPVPRASGQGDLVARFVAATHLIGYRAEMPDVLSAFRSRFRTGAQGAALGVRDVAAAESLALQS